MSGGVVMSQRRFDREVKKASERLSQWWDTSHNVDVIVGHGQNYVFFDIDVYSFESRVYVEDATGVLHAYAVAVAEEYEEYDDGELHCTEHVPVGDDFLELASFDWTELVREVALVRVEIAADIETPGAQATSLADAMHRPRLGAIS